VSLRKVASINTTSKKMMFLEVLAVRYRLANLVRAKDDDNKTDSEARAVLEAARMRCVELIGYDPHDKDIRELMTLCDWLDDCVHERIPSIVSLMHGLNDAPSLSLGDLSFRLRLGLRVARGALLRQCCRLNQVNGRAWQFAFGKGNEAGTADVDGFDSTSTAAGSEGWSPLFFSCVHGAADSVRLLCEHKADVNAVDSKGRTALALASSKGHTDAMRVLCEHNADVNTGNQTGLTSLMLACEKGNISAVQLLCDHKAGVDAVNKEGWTA
jgi:hypothetical protein